MRTVRASELGAFLYCRRAWWYQVSGHPSENRTELAAGEHLHEQHGQSVMLTGCLRTLAYLLLFSALVLAAVYFALQLV